MIRALRAGGLAALATYGDTCGPTSHEVGQAVLWAAPIITVVVFFLAWGYAALWRPLRDAPMKVDPRPSLVVLAVQLLLALTTLLSPDIDQELIGIAVWAVGTSYLTFQVFALRLALRSGSRTYSWAIVAPWAALYPPAVLLGLFMTDSHPDLADMFTTMWILPGFAGWVAGPLVLIAIIEVVLRRWLRSRRNRPPPPPPPPDIPEARAVKQ